MHILTTRAPQGLKSLALILLILFVFSGCSAAPGAPTNASPTPTPTAPPPVATPAWQLASPSPDPAAEMAALLAARSAYVDGCVYVNLAEALAQPDVYLNAKVKLVASLAEVDVQNGTALFYNQWEPAAQIAGTFHDAALLRALESHPYYVLYGVYTGADRGSQPDYVNTIHVQVEYLRGFAGDDTYTDVPLTEEYLEGTWMEDPEGKDPFYYTYAFSGNHLLINSHAFGKLSTVFDGTYTFTKPNRVHHRYTVTSYDLETGEPYGEWPGKLNHEMVPFTKDIMRVENAFFFRMGAELPPFSSSSDDITGISGSPGPGAVTPAPSMMPSAPAQTPADTAMPAAAPTAGETPHVTGAASEANPDSIGRFRAPNTSIDAPILYDKIFFYHDHDEQGRADARGSIYAFYSVLTRNVILQGKNGSQERPLLRELHTYKEDLAAFKTAKNRIFKISVFGIDEWELFALYETPEDEPASTGKTNYSHLSSASAQEVEAWVKAQKERSLLKGIIDVPVSGDDVLMTIITWPEYYRADASEGRYYLFLKAVID